MDVFLVCVTAKDELQLGSGDDFADDVEHVVTDDSFGSGEVADTHFDDPTLDVGDLIGAPLLDVLLHGDILWLPVIVLHRLIKIVSPLILERENVEEHGVFTVDHSLGVECEFCLRFIEGKSAASEFYCGGRHDVFLVSEGIRRSLYGLT